MIITNINILGDPDSNMHFPESVRAVGEWRIAHWIEHVNMQRSTKRDFSQGRRKCLKSSKYLDPLVSIREPEIPDIDHENLFFNFL